MPLDVGDTMVGEKRRHGTLRKNDARKTEGERCGKKD